VVAAIALALVTCGPALGQIPTARRTSEEGQDLLN
jgi:hypothetical protein